MNLAPGWPRLPGRRFVFTNGDADYAGRVLAAIGIDDQFHAVGFGHGIAFLDLAQGEAIGKAGASAAVDREEALVDVLEGGAEDGRAVGELRLALLDIGRRVGRGFQRHIAEDLLVGVGELVPDMWRDLRGQRIDFLFADAARQLPAPATRRTIP